HTVTHPPNSPQLSPTAPARKPHNPKPTQHPANPKYTHRLLITSTNPISRLILD
ncbi:hypothetical protein B0H34DRAFT_696652, partial [Crassisporium funariophilum]